MAVPSVMNDLSTTANNNSPAGSESPISTDDFHRAIQAILRTTNAKASDIASAATTDIGAATAEFVDVTGTTTITGLGTIGAGIVRTVRFTGALTLTHNATSLILPTGANVTTAAGDVAMFRSLGAGNWVCVGYLRKDGSALALGDGTVTNAKLAFDGGAFGYRNRIINGTGRVNQEGLTTVNTDTTYLVDMWQYLVSGTSLAANFGISDDGTLSLVGPRHFFIQTSTAKATLAAGDYALFNTSVEGYNWADLKYGTSSAKTSTLSFRARVDGVASATVSVALRNANATRSYVTTVNLTNTAQDYTFTIPGDTAGTWNNTNGKGLEVLIAHACGTTLQTSTLNAWQAGNFVAANTQTNLLGTLNAASNATDFQLERGPTKTAYDLRSFNQELGLAQRYFESGSVYEGFSGNVTSATSYRAFHTFKVAKRATPTVILVNNEAVSFPATAGAVESQSDNGFRENRTANVTGVGFFSSTWTASARF